MTGRADVILGAGLAGLTAALTLQDLGETSGRRYEREDRVGGHARSIEVDGYTFDFGPHILFAADPDIGALIRDLLGTNFVAQSREAFIYHQAHDLYTRFPFQAHLHGLPTEIVVDCLAGLVRAVEDQARGEVRPRNYEEWMRGTFGDGIAEHLMIPYARKIWTIDPREMEFGWIGKRVPTPDVERIIAGAVSEDVTQVGATAHFWYPKEGGIEALPRALGERVENVQLGREVERIDLGARAVVFSDGERVAFNRMIYTLPLSQVSSLVDDVPSPVREACDGLRCQGIYCVNVGVDRADVSDKHWVYFYEDEFPFHRLSFPGNFTRANVPEGRSSISMEIAFSAARDLDREHIVDDALEALRAAKILRADDRVEVVHAQEILPAYVIYDLDHSSNVGVIRTWLEDHGIVLAGRFGEWQYLNMDHAMKSGREAARAVAGAASGLRPSASERRTGVAGGD